MMTMTDEDVLNKLEDTTKNAKLHQLETLRSILEHNNNVSYLQPYLHHHHQHASTDIAESFKRNVPLSTYEDYADHIDQMANRSLVDHDHRPLLSVDPLLCFFFSSGTSTMKPKLIPYFDSQLSKAASFLAHQGSVAVLRRSFPPLGTRNKVLWFIYADNVTTTKGGYKVMAASTYPLQRGDNAKWLEMVGCTSPREVVFGSNFEHQLYCHLLCGLRNSDMIASIRAAYATGLVRALSMLESKWEQLCHDLECGVPCSEITDVTMRNSVIEVLGGPRVVLAKRIRSICEGKNWDAMIPKLWPNVRYVKCVATGSMKQYYAKLKFYAGEIPVLGGDYFASECCVGINLDIMQPPESTRYVILPTAAYFEFLPFDLDGSGVVGKETVDISGVEVGKTYELVVTTYRGLYRYLLGDIVKVVGFYNSSPELEFVMRAPKTSAEIITERDIISAMESFQPVLRNAIAAEVSDFSSYLDMDLSPKQLKVFVEVEEVFTSLQEKLQESITVLRKCCSCLEDGLGAMYKLHRKKGEVGPLILSIVKPGTVHKLLHIAVENGAPATQYKPSKIIRNRKAVDFLEASALVSVCSGTS